MPSCLLKALLTSHVQVLRQNALPARVLLEAVGAAARAAWPGHAAFQVARVLAPAHTLLELLTAILHSDLFLAQELGQNALLARVLLEAVGAVARAVGPRFAASGRLLRLALLPLLERLADPCASVAAAAAAALSSVCSNCGCVRARLHDGSV